jgi:peptidoglycan/LPS O-acetylase OafA/YrhL
MAGNFAASRRGGKIMQQPTRFYSLDILRGLAALSVVLWHFTNFFAFGGPIVRPFDSVLFPFYYQGNFGVDTFFCISGFVFYWLYSQRIAKNRISFGRFAWLRFSRLWPLHALALFLILGLQTWFASSYGNGEYFYYASDNSVSTFLISLSYLAAVPFVGGGGWNGPEWSVFVEIFCYAIFFFFCRKFKIRWFLLLALCVIGYTVMQVAQKGILEDLGGIGGGMRCFFLGGLMFLAFDKIIQMNSAKKVAKTIWFLVVCGWILAIVIQYGFALDMRTVQPLLAKAWSFGIIFTLFPATILSLALAEHFYGGIGKRLSWIGDISYSSYLLHFPLALVFALIVCHFGWQETFVRTNGFFVLYLCCLVPLCLASHKFFEMPLQKRLRKYFKDKETK